MSVTRLESPEQESQDQQLLSPAEFRLRLFEDMRSEKDYIFVKSFIWRKDGFGDEFAHEVLEAADRSVPVFILKDALGAIYEYGEESGQSFLHDEVSRNISLYIQGKAIATLYGHPVQPPRKNPLRTALLQHPSVHVVDRDIHDHSKVVILGGKKAYVSGINFGNEFTRENKPWNDLALRIDNAESVKSLLQLLAGIQIEETNSDGMFGHEGLEASLSQFIRETREELIILMAYLGNPVYAQNLLGILRQKCRVTLVIPGSPTVNVGTNLNVVRRLAASAQQYADFLTVVKSDQMVHAKALLRDGQTLRLGSQNMTVSNNLLDTIAETEDKDVIKTFKSVLLNLVTGDAQAVSGGHLLEQFGSLSAADSVKMLFETGAFHLTKATSNFSNGDVAHGRDQGKTIAKTLIETFHGTKV